MKRLGLTWKWSSAALLLVAAVWAGAGWTAQTRGPGIEARGEVLVDGSGREVVLRGVNAGGACKLPPFIPFAPEPDFDTALERYADGLVSLGFNVVRLLVIHEAAEPEPWVYDQAYLERYDRMVEALARRGIYIIVDSHQDLFNRHLFGDGFPDWAIAEKYRDRPERADAKRWNIHYFGRPVASSFDRLWDNSNGLQDHVAALFGMLAERYRDQPMVIGFEPINEPMPGTKGLIFYEGFHKKLYAFYERVATAVHAADPRYLIFADICAIENTGTINPDRSRPRVDNLVLAPHYYDTAVFGMSFTPGGDTPIMRQGLRAHLALAKHWAVPVLLTEFGVPTPADFNPPWVRKFYGLLDEFKLSGTYWEASIGGQIWNGEDTSIFEADGSVRDHAFALDRPYPRAVAGEIVSFSFDPDSLRFELIYQPDPAIAAPTVIHLPPRLYGSSPKVTTEPELKFEFDAVRGDLLVFTPSGETVRVVIEP